MADEQGGSRLADEQSGLRLGVGQGEPSSASEQCGSRSTDEQGEQSKTPAQASSTYLGEVVKLDRGFPLVRLDATGALLRAKHATLLVKGENERATIGDKVRVSCPAGNDIALIESIDLRTRALVRKDPTERALAQVLAANFDRVMVVQAISELNMRRLERELVLAHETKAQVNVVLTKADLVEDAAEIERVRARVCNLAGPEVLVLVVSESDAESIENVRALIPKNSLVVLMGKSGVGKSSLVNALAGKQVQRTGAVRTYDGKGRHTTVSREMIEVLGGGRVIDMPGVRGLGLWDADEGIGAAFDDIESLSAQCRFRDCKHEGEPGCAVQQAVESGQISAERLKSYRALKQETQKVNERREQARWMRGQKRTKKKR